MIFLQYLAAFQPPNTTPVASSMCGRYTLYSDKKAIEKQFGAACPDEDLIRPSYNIAPGSIRPVILVKGASDRVMGALRWGFVPSFVSDSSDWKPLINARSETIHEKPSFKKSFQRRRCIIPGNGFFEWKDFGDGKKIPFFIRLLDQNLFGMAGIHDSHSSPDGTEEHTFAILTTRANALVQPLHHRLPVILHQKDYEAWLDPVHPRPESLLSLIGPYPTDRMSAYKVTTEVNSTRHDHPGLVTPVIK